MARIQIADLPEEQALSAKEMAGVVGGWGWGRSWRPDPRSFFYRAGQQQRYVAQRRQVTVTQYVRQYRDMFRNGFGSQYFGNWTNA